MNNDSGGVSPPPSFNNFMEGIENTTEQKDTKSNKLFFRETIPLLKCLETKINSQADRNLLSEIEVPISLIPEFEKIVEQGFYVEEKTQGDSSLNNIPVEIDTQVKNAAIKLIDSIKFKATRYWADDESINEFIPTDSMPFVVYLESIDKNAGQMRDIQVGKLLMNSRIEGISKISKRGKNRIGVEFSSIKHANKFLKSDFPVYNNFKGFIPHQLISCKGILREIDPNLSVEMIFKNLKASNKCPILGVQRLQRRKEVDGKFIFVNTASVVITFRGRNLPQYTTLFYTVRVPEGYISPVIQCKNCCRYGHVARQCRSKIRCAACAGEHDTETCSKKSSPTCIFCKNDHLSNEQGTRLSQRICPEFNLQKQIKVHMARYNCSFIEAANACRQYEVNDVDSTNIRNDLTMSATNFPPLPSQIHPNDLAQGNSSYSSLPSTSTRKHFNFSKIVNRSQPQTIKRKSNSDMDYILYKHGRVPNQNGNSIIHTQSANQLTDDPVMELVKNNNIIKSLRAAFNRTPQSISEFIKEFIPSSYHKNLQWLDTLRSTQAQVY